MQITWKVLKTTEFMLKHLIGFYESTRTETGKQIKG